MRTFHRYFAAKEDAVAPILEAGWLDLGQQIRIDMWPTPYPYDLDYDPFSAT